MSEWKGNDAHQGQPDPADNPARIRLIRYIEQVHVPARFPEDQLANRVARKLVPGRIRATVALILTDLASIRERHKARRLRRALPLRLHLGSARNKKRGWLNIDLLGHPVDLAWNLKRRLPLRATRLTRSSMNISSSIYPSKADSSYATNVFVFSNPRASSVSASQMHSLMLGRMLAATDNFSNSLDPIDRRHSLPFRKCFTRGGLVRCTMPKH